jgi:hypothetical protein
MKQRVGVGRSSAGGGVRTSVAAAAAAAAYLGVPLGEE